MILFNILITIHFWDKVVYERFCCLRVVNNIIKINTYLLLIFLQNTIIGHKLLLYSLNQLMSYYLVLWWWIIHMKKKSFCLENCAKWYTCQKNRYLEKKTWKSQQMAKNTENSKKKKNSQQLNIQIQRFEKSLNTIWSRI